MNAGRDFAKAVVLAWKNAKTDRRLRYLHNHAGAWWISRSRTEPPTPVVVFPDGRISHKIKGESRRHVYDFMPGQIET